MFLKEVTEVENSILQCAIQSLHHSAVVMQGNALSGPFAVMSSDWRRFHLSGLPLVVVVVVTSHRLQGQKHNFVLVWKMQNVAVKITHF